MIPVRYRNRMNYLWKTETDTIEIISTRLQVTFTLDSSYSGFYYCILAYLSLHRHLSIYIYQNIIIYIYMYIYTFTYMYIYIHWFTSLFIYLFINFFIHLFIHYISTNEKYVCSSKHPPSRITKAGRIETQLLKGMDASDIFGISIPVIAFDEAIFSCN